MNRSHCVPIISSSANSVNNNSNVIQTGITPPEVVCKILILFQI